MPRRAFWTLVVALFWFPVYESLHQGQITLPLTALLAAGIGRGPVLRGFFVGLVTAIKPTFGLLLPFMPILFGRRCLAGMALGLLPAVIAWPWFVEYLRLFPTIAGLDYDFPSSAGLLGVVPSAGLTCLVCAWIVWRIDEKEWAYLLIIGAVSIGTALWIHSYTPVILPVVYAINCYLNGSPSFSGRGPR